LICHSERSKESSPLPSFPRKRESMGKGERKNRVIITYLSSPLSKGDRRRILTVIPAQAGIQRQKKGESVQAGTSSPFSKEPALSEANGES
jgi:hypothetical protein